MNDNLQGIPEELRRGLKLGWGRVAELVPDDGQVQAVLGHPLHHALAALWQGRPGAVPVEEIVRTTRAYTGEYFYAQAPGPAKRLPDEGYRHHLQLAKEGGGFAEGVEENLDFIRMLSDRYGEPDFRLWVQAPRPGHRVEVSYDQWITEILLWGGLKPPPLEGSVGEVSEGRESAARLLTAVARMIRNIEIWDMEEQAKAFTRGLREDSWDEIRELAGQASSRGRTAHPTVVDYWKRIRMRVSDLIKDRRNEVDEFRAEWWQLWKGERELVDAGTLRDYTPSEVAAYLLWERADRRKTLVTFARHMGVSLRKDTAEEMVEKVEREE